MIQVKPIFDAAAQDDGLRILVERRWPRGLNPVKEKVDMWLLDAAPSRGLLDWFRRNRGKWPEFQERYRRELGGQRSCLELIREIEKKGPVTLLHAAPDAEHSYAATLRDLLRPDSDQP